MKDIVFYLLLITTGIGSIDFNNYTTTVKEVIEFKAVTGFNGRCEGKCNVYFGSKILTVNGQPPEADVYYPLFVQCPSKIRIQEGKIYKFEVERFNFNDCTTVIDTLTDTRPYKLLRLLSK